MTKLEFFRQLKVVICFFIASSVSTNILAVVLSSLVVTFLIVI